MTELVRPGDVAIAAWVNSIGTVGASVRDSEGERFVLTAAHVVGAHASSVPPGSVVESRANPSSARFALGEVGLTSPSAPKKAGDYWQMGLDSALVKLDDAHDVAFSSTVAPQRTVRAVAGPGETFEIIDVWMRGATTGYVEGEAILVEVPYTVHPRKDRPAGYHWPKTFMITPAGGYPHFAQRGDSGGIVCSMKDNKPIGIMVGGDTKANGAVHCVPIRHVLTEFGVELI